MKSFRGMPLTKIFDNGNNYKMYGFSVDKLVYPDVKFTKYGNATICGDLPDLEPELEYDVVADEQYSDRYGYRYVVSKISLVKDFTESSVISFLSQISTPTRAKTIYDAYPDIIDRVIKGEEIDISKLKNIGEDTFQKIKDKIITNYKLLDYVNLFGGAISLNKIQKLYEESSSIQRIEELLHKDPYFFLTNIGGIGFKKADIILDSLIKDGKIKFDYDLKPSLQRCKSAIDYILRENESDGNTKMELRACYDQLKKLASECIPVFKEAVEDNRFFTDIPNMIIARRKTYNDECWVCQTILDAMNLSCVKYDIDIEKYRKTDDFELSDEQMDFLKMVLENNMTILTAAGGTGKSAATGVLVKMLSDSGISCLLMTPTGKSAKVLEAYAKYPAHTIHRALGYNPTTGWNDTPVPYDVVIVDEFSMCSLHLMKHILRSIDFTTTRLVMIGDNEQLPPINAGNLLHDFIYSKQIPTSIFTKVFRYGSNGLLTVATDIRFGKEYLSNDEALVTFGDNKDYIFKRCIDEKMLKEALAIYKKLLTTGYNGKIYKPEDIVILSSYNRGEYGAVNINEKIQNILHNDTEQNVKYGDNIYYVNDIVMQTKNDYKCLKYNGDEKTTEEDGVFLITNGETGIVKNINKFNELGVDFEMEELVKRTFGNKDSLQLGYSCTIHKMQGSSAKAVILLTPKAHSFFLNSNLIYVGVTRTTDVCFHLGLQNTVKNALKKKENFNRMTFTQDFLRKNGG